MSPSPSSPKNIPPLFALLFCFLASASTAHAAPASQPTTQASTTLPTKNQKKTTPQKKTAHQKKTTPPHKKTAQKKKPQGKKKTPQASASRPLKRWLLLGQAPLPLPIFSKEKGGEYKPERLLEEDHLDQARLQPKEGRKRPWLGGKSLRWRAWDGQGLTLDPAFLNKDENAKAGQTPSAPPALAPTTPKIAWAAVWLHADRYTEIKLQLQAHSALRVFLDGKPVGQKAACTPRPQAQQAASASSQAPQPPQAPPPPKRPSRRAASPSPAQAILAMLCLNASPRCSNDKAPSSKDKPLALTLHNAPSPRPKQARSIRRCAYVQVGTAS